MSKNYCSDHEVKNEKTKEAGWQEKTQAFLEYLKRPKTIFDLKDRMKAGLFLTVLIIAIQFLIKKLL